MAERGVRVVAFEVNDRANRTVQTILMPNAG
jgi:hypothetical protein